MFQTSRTLVRHVSSQSWTKLYMLPFSSMLYATDSVTLNGSVLGAGLQLTVSNTARRGHLMYVTGSAFNPRAIKGHSSYLQHTKPDSFLCKERNLRTVNTHSWFYIFALFWMLYAFFWVISRRLNFICRRFETLCLVHLYRWICVEWICLRNVGVFIQEKVCFENSLSQ
jgi:hypothetical protein